jgi:hypothetical protein
MAAAFFPLAIELLTAGSQAADGAGFQLFASRSKKQIPIIRFVKRIRVGSEDLIEPLPPLALHS